MLVRYLYTSKWVSVRQSVISKSVSKLAGFLYVDDTDLVALNSGEKSAEAIVVRAQLLVDQWQYVLQLTGRELKHSKYFWTLQNYSWRTEKCMLDTTTSFYITVKDRDNKVPI